MTYVYYWKIVAVLLAISNDTDAPGLLLRADSMLTLNYRKGEVDRCLSRFIKITDRNEKGSLFNIVFGDAALRWSSDNIL